MKVIKRVLVSMASFALIAGASLGLASPASALSGCTLGYTTNGGASAVCTSGTGEIRAAIGCTKWITGTYVYTRYGAWVGRGQVSQARCQWGETPRVTNNRVWHWIEYR